MSLLEPFLKKRVLVLTADGRSIIGNLRGIDQVTNIILDKCEERVYSEVGESVEVLILGVHLLKGDDIAVIGEIDEEKDKNLDLNQITAPPLKSITH